MISVTIEDIQSLLTLFVTKGQYDARTGDQGRYIHHKCEELFEKDYVCCKIDNAKGSLSQTYPSSIIIPSKEKNVDCLKSGSSRSSESSVKFDADTFKDLASKSNLARCRTRFPVPVILCEGKFVCRSATLACGKELIFGGRLHEIRRIDIRLLEEMSVNYICDLMVENKKIKYYMEFSSSEKIDKENRYSDFQIVKLPYPGCEFFKNYKDNNYVAEGLMFDWEQDHVNVSLMLPDMTSLGINWTNYKLWDLAKLTQNYLKLLLSYVTEGTSGILIHCISGWDRTPLFVSLLRMSLWADGLAHSSLTVHEMAYLTLAYDWYLFGHDLPTRLKVGEEILFFCFDFLKFIASDEFSRKKRCRKTSCNAVEPCLEALLEEDFSTKASVSDSASSTSQSKCENSGNSIFYATLDPPSDSCTPSNIHSSPDSDESDSVKSVKSNIQNGSTSSGTPPSLVSTLENLTNNNGSPRNPSSSSPVPVPMSRQRFDSMSSLGSWQLLSGTGSLLGSVTSRSSVEMHGTLPHHLPYENGNMPSSSNVGIEAEDRAEKLTAIRTLMVSTYRKMIADRDNSGGSSYFPWKI